MVINIELTETILKCFGLHEAEMKMQDSNLKTSRSGRLLQIFACILDKLCNVPLVCLFFFFSNVLELLYLAGGPEALIHK